MNRGILGASATGGALNSFCFTLMVLHFLQRVCVVPCVPILPVLPLPTTLDAANLCDDDGGDVAADTKTNAVTIDNEITTQCESKADSGVATWNLPLLVLRFFQAYGREFDPTYHIITVSSFAPERELTNLDVVAHTDTKSPKFSPLVATNFATMSPKLLSTRASDDQLLTQSQSGLFLRSAFLNISDGRPQVPCHTTLMRVLL
jgi:hypothetical protein